MGLALKFSLYRILVFSGFGLGKIHCISGFGLGKIHCISGFGLGKIHCIFKRERSIGFSNHVLQK